MDYEFQNKVKSFADRQFLWSLTKRVSGFIAATYLAAQLYPHVPHYNIILSISVFTPSIYLSLKYIPKKIFPKNKIGGILAAIVVSASLTIAINFLNYQSIKDVSKIKGIVESSYYFKQFRYHGVRTRGRINLPVPDHTGYKVFFPEKQLRIHIRQLGQAKILDNGDNIQICQGNGLFKVSVYYVCA